MRSLGVACLGAGYFARFHHDAWQRLPDVDLLAVADHDLRRAEAAAPRAFARLQDMLDACDVDILDIVVPPAGHAEAIRTALDAGVRLIVCQKPFCTSLAEAEQMAALADRHGVPLVVHENFRFQPWYRKMRVALGEGRIGAPLQMSFRLRPGDGQGPRAYLDRQPYFQEMERFLIHETGVHWIDTFRYLLGDPVSVYADLRRLNPQIRGEDAGYFILDHGAGLRSMFDGNRLLDHAAANCRTTMGEALLEGTEGALELLGDGSVHLRRFGGGQRDVILAPRDWDGFGGDCVLALNRHVAEHLLHGSPLENRAADYLQVIRIEQAVYRSAETGQRVSLATE